MTSENIVYAIEDLQDFLSYGSHLGMHVLLDEPHGEAGPRYLNVHEIHTAEPANYLLFFPRWIYGEFFNKEITSGRNAGKHFTVRANFASVSASFLKLRKEGDKSRLGAGEIGFSRDWLRLPEKDLIDVPGDVEPTYRKLLGRISSGRKARGGSSTYRICKNALIDLQMKRALPPYDYIEIK